jgi:hypothetical protein
VKKHLEYRDEKSKGYNGKEDRQDVEQDVQACVNPIRAGKPHYFDKVFHRCKDKCLQENQYDLQRESGFGGRSETKIEFPGLRTKIPQRRSYPSRYKNSIEPEVTRKNLFYLFSISW